MRFSWLVALLAALAACQPVPQPFRHNGAAPDIAAPPVSTGVTVLPVARAPEPTATELSRAMAAALRDANIAAATFGGNRATLFLQGEVQDDGAAAAVVWELFDSTGDLVGSHAQPIDGTDVARWQDADPALMRDLAAAGVGPLAALIRPSAAPAQAGGLPVALPPIRGDAPAGAPQLAAAMLAAFAAGQTTVNLTAERDAAPAAYDLRGVVSLDPPRAAGQTVTITWNLTDRDGAVLGSIVQTNTLPTAVLAGDWQTIAPPIAAAALPGILDLIDRLGIAEGADRAS